MLTAEEWPAERAERVRADRRRLFEAVRTLARSSDPSPALARALWRAQQMRQILPAHPDAPRAKYAAAWPGGWRSCCVTGCRPPRIRAWPSESTWSPCTGACGRRAERAGELRFAHGDRHLHDWPLSERPGWLRIQRLVQERQIGMLIVDSADDLVPPAAAPRSWLEPRDDRGVAGELRHTPGLP